MNQKLLLVSGLSTLGLGFLLNACQPSTPINPPPPPPATVIEINNSNNTYSPSTLTVKLDGAAKTITIRALAGHPFQIVGSNWPFATVANPNQDQVVTFTAPGTYKFYCAFHGFPVNSTDVGGMSGTITVEN